MPIVNGITYHSPTCCDQNAFFMDKTGLVPTGDKGCSCLKWDDPEYVKKKVEEWERHPNNNEKT